MTTSLPPALVRLIDALATKAANDYLTEKAQPEQADTTARPNPAPLPARKSAA